jgi:hypothetical protein
MTTTNGNTGELEAAIQELEGALRHASEAAARLKAALPRIERMSSVFDELESIIAAGRSEPTGEHAAPTPIASAPAARSPRPARAKQPAATIDEPIAEPAAAIAEPAAAIEEAPVEASEPTETIAPEVSAAPTSEKLISFRLEFESNPGPLNLRAVDDAISEHPAVRDVALLDYDGKRAALKVWIAEPASPAEVQQSLSERATQIGGDGRQISIVALEDVA